MTNTINSTKTSDIISLINKVLKTNKKDFNITYRTWDNTYTVRFISQKKVRGYLEVAKNKATFSKA